VEMGVDVGVDDAGDDVFEFEASMHQAQVQRKRQ